MNSLFLRIIALLIFFSSVSSCNQMPREVSNKQLVAVKYYKEEMKGDVLRKSYFYYKPYIYHYANKPYSGIVKDYDDKRLLKSEGRMENGFPHGQWTYYNSNGSVKSQGVFREGVKDSIWYHYYVDGSPKLIESYTLKNDTLKSDTIMAWHYNGQKMLETYGDTIKRYYQNGRLLAKTILGIAPLQEIYMSDGLIIFRKDAYKKEVFYVGGKLQNRTYYLNSKIGKEMLFKEKHKWTNEERGALEHADSILFDYSNYWDPVIKIYVKD